MQKSSSNSSNSCLDSSSSGTVQDPQKGPSGSSPHESASPAQSLEEAASDVFTGFDLSSAGSEIVEAARPVLAVPSVPAFTPADSPTPGEKNFLADRDLQWFLESVYLDEL